MSQEERDWLEWLKRASRAWQNTHARLAKGSHVMVQESVRTSEYEKDGVKQRIFELRADSIGKLDRAERKQERRC